MPLRINLDINLLKDLYFNKKINSVEIARIVKCDYKTILRRFSELGLKIRSKKEYIVSEEAKKKMSLAKRGIYDGKKNPMYGKRHSVESKNKMSKSHKGKKPSQETRRKMSESHKGKKVNITWGGKISKSLMGRKIPLETIEKIRKANIGRKLTLKQRERMRKSKLGSKNPAYIDGRYKGNRAERNCLRYSTWGERVFKRDNWTCQECGKRGGYLHAHHIKPFAKYKKVRFDTKNGITLCKECHLKTKGKEEDLVSYFKSKLGFSIN